MRVTVRFARRLAVACLLLAATTINTAAACQPAPTPDLPPAALLARYLQHEADCARHAPFLYRLGQLLNTAGRYPEAVDRLEAALLHAPDDLPTRIEFAIALVGSGDEAAARQLLAQLRRAGALDAATRQQIDRLLTHPWLAAARPHTSLGLFAGHDDNLLGSARQGPFDLTLPDGNLTVIPAADQQPRAGYFLRADLRIEGRLAAAARPIQYGLFVSQRVAPGQDADRLSWGMLLENQPFGTAGGYLQVGHQQHAQQGATLYRQTHLGLGHALNANMAGRACQHRVGAEWQQRDYPQADRQDGRYLGLQARTHCLGQALQLALRAGIDRPQHPDRPGGAQRHAALRLAHQTDLWRGKVHAEAEWSWQQDAAGYSPLLENNRRRVLRRGGYRIEHRWHGAPGDWQPYISLEWLNQHANLPLFTLQNRVVSLGLVAQW